MKHLKTFEGVFEDIPEHSIVPEDIQELAIQMCIDGEVDNIEVGNANDIDVRGDNSHFVVEVDWLDDNGDGEIRINIQLTVTTTSCTSVVTVENQDTGQLETSNSGEYKPDTTKDIVEIMDELVGTGMYLSVQVQQSGGHAGGYGEQGEYNEDDDADDYSEQGSPAGW